MWVFEQISGRLSRNNATLCFGYSGHGDGVNNPALEDVADIGPIPRGVYTMTAVEESPNTGPFSIVLVPDPCNQMFGRSNFRIHGDEVTHPGEHLASEGCIVCDRSSREVLWRSGDRSLQVVDTLRTEDQAWPYA
ncbi:MAG TPA: tlde1 domain-containing protein [Candidatus Acidoferrales bacterium]|nr:tlde1 domain-containing protein [Candidatus Acidoferrales bacterium]